MEFKEYKQTRDKIYLAYLEEKCHIHPTAEVKFEEDEDLEDGNKAIFARIGGFDSGLRFTEGDILTWFIEQDIKPSEIKDYSKDYWDNLQEEVDDVFKNKSKDAIKIIKDKELISKELLEKVRKDAEEHPVQINTDIATVHDVTDYTKVKMGCNSEIEFLIEERRRNGGGTFEYGDTFYIVHKDGSVTTKKLEHPKYDTAEDTLKMIDADDWK